ncbi:MAG TPA: hypothetical protein V6D12_06075 [Candidatus Obscuribacterales bacterium]
MKFLRSVSISLVFSPKQRYAHYAFSYGLCDRTSLNLRYGTPARNRVSQVLLRMLQAVSYCCWAITPHAIG